MPNLVAPMPTERKKARRWTDYDTATGTFLDEDTGERVTPDGTPYTAPATYGEPEPLSSQDYTPTGQPYRSPLPMPTEHLAPEDLPQERLKRFLTESPGMTRRPVYSSKLFTDLGEPVQIGEEPAPAKSRLERAAEIGGVLLENPIVEAIGTTPALQTGRSALRAARGAKAIAEEAAPGVKRLLTEEAGGIKLPEELPSGPGGGGLIHEGSILAKHGVEDRAKFTSLVRDMEQAGKWPDTIPPVLSVGDEAITGSHRIAAAKSLGIPVKYIDIVEQGVDFEGLGYSLEELLVRMDDDDIVRMLREADRPDLIPYAKKASDTVPLTKLPEPPRAPETAAEAVPGPLTTEEIRAAGEAGIPIQQGKEAEIREAIESGKERGFARTVRTAEVTPEAIQAELTQHPRTYDPITNAGTVEEATHLLDTDLAKARSLILDSDEAPDALTTVTGELLANRLIRSADTADQEDGLRILDKLFERATTGGQGIQAFSIYGRLSPEGILLHAQRVVKQAQKQWPGVKLTVDQAAEFSKRAEALQGMEEGRDKVLASAELMRDVYSLLPRSALSKLALVQTLAQLLNPKTMVRNLFGNLLFWPAENLARLVAVGYDIPISLVSGQRSVVGPNIPRQIRATGRGTMDAIEEIGRDLNLRNLPTQYDITTGKGFHQMGPQFRGVPILGGLERALSYEMRVFDRAFFEAGADDGLWNWAQVTAMNEGKDASVLFANPTKEGIQAAYMEGLYRTFQDESTAAVAFTTIKRGLNLGQDFGVGDLVLKYPRTPGNLLARGIEYTPYGVFQAVFDVAKNAFLGKAFDQKAFVETLGRATVGTVGLTVPGAYLASLGILTGRGPRDKDLRALQRESGERPYSFNVSAFKRLVFSGFNADMAKRRLGDTLISYDWALPLSLPVAMAAEAGTLQPTKLGKREAPSILADLSDNLFLQMGAAGMDALGTGLDTIAVQPMTQGLRKLFGSANLGDNLVAVMATLPSSFVPSMLGQIQQLTDNTMKETWRPIKWEEGLTTALGRLPILAAALPERLNVWGEPADRYHNDTNHPFNVFVNPAFIGDYLPRPEAEMVIALHEATGQTVQFPRVAPKEITVDGRRYELTPDQLVEYQGVLGQATRKAFGELAQSESFRKSDPEDQVKFLARVLDDLNLQAKLILHERYNEASGAVNPIPAPKAKLGAFGRLIGKDAPQVFNDMQVLQYYEDTPDRILARYPNYRTAVARAELDPRYEESTVYKRYEQLVAEERKRLRRRPDIWAAGHRMGYSGFEKRPR